ncbi:hypothetical protein DM02DRAFT_273787 [Periconia macrospinosa]|uniref:Uncharacterized protein n=1 Tax=Periconia macrospinosa TaxID=97972 RepID=A0A2V1DXJ4_9PLEO|nr:hypothetical protein DM02DRAFT_273787 [Periconia macrospinosa]
MAGALREELPTERTEPTPLIDPQSKRQASQPGRWRHSAFCTVQSRVAHTPMHTYTYTQSSRTRHQSVTRPGGASPLPCHAFVLTYPSRQSAHPGVYDMHSTVQVSASPSPALLAAGTSTVR